MNRTPAAEPKPAVRVAKDIVDPERDLDAIDAIKARSKYMSQEDIDTHCKDKSDKCEFWKSIGECTKNPSYLFQNCAKTCDACWASLPKDRRCTLSPDFLPLVDSPGGLNNMFEAIINNAEFKERYNTTVLSSDPYVLQFDNFGRREEWDQIESMYSALVFILSSGLFKPTRTSLSY